MGGLLDFDILAIVFSVGSIYASSATGARLERDWSATGALLFYTRFNIEFQRATCLGHPKREFQIISTSHYQAP